MVGKRIKINEMNEIVSNLWNLTGIIDKIEGIDHSETREAFEGYREKPCEDEIYYWIKFDIPLTREKYGVDWKRMWLKREHFTTID